MFWLDPWWLHSSIAYSTKDNLIVKSRSHAFATVREFAETEVWTLPQPTTHQHHSARILSAWLSTSTFPDNHLDRPDVSLWDGNAKITTRDNWESTRTAGDKVTWNKSLWIKNGITHNALYHWFLCRVDSTLL